jgi:hypothetical protein
VIQIQADVDAVVLVQDGGRDGVDVAVAACAQGRKSGLHQSDLSGGEVRWAAMRTRARDTRCDVSGRGQGRRT